MRAPELENNYNFQSEILNHIKVNDKLKDKNTYISTHYMIKYTVLESVFSFFNLFPTLI